ncbi:Uncharacterised protein [Candidatus Gugararchaeum adminiculabundum]|nr:Uncharacterised protein [Candidatus Gugararchaeum adminiculabundum]
MLKCRVLLRLKDAPGALVESLKPISGHGGNIQNITHLRENSEGEGGFVPTIINFEISDLSALEALKADLSKVAQIRELSADGKKLLKKKSVSILLLGHVMDTDAKNTLDRLMDAGADARNFTLSISDSKKPSCALITLDMDEKNFDPILSALDKLSKEKGLLVIRE